MKIGSLVRIVWTVGVAAPPVFGVVVKMLANKPEERQRVKIFSNGKFTWFERGDLEVIAA